MLGLFINVLKLDDGGESWGPSRRYQTVDIHVLVSQKVRKIITRIVYFFVCFLLLAKTLAGLYYLL